MSTLVIKDAIVNFSRLSGAIDNGYGSEKSAFFTGVSDNDAIKLAKYGILCTTAVNNLGDELVGYNFRRYTKTQRGVMKKPLVIVNSEKEAISDMIGNGSSVNLKLEIYPSAYSESGWGYQLNAIQVTHLVKVAEIVSQTRALYHNEDF